MKKVSVIVVIYEVEKYLRTCIDSILAQTYKNLEIILSVCFGEDTCETICDEYALKDDRIVVIKSEPEGVSKTRNQGLSCVTGDYLAWVDGDDYVEPFFIEKLVDSLEESQTDMAIICHDEVICNGKMKPGNETADYNEAERGYEHRMLVKHPKSGVYSREQILENILLYKGVNLYVWDKLYKTSFVKNLVFEGVNHGEDRLWLCDMLQKTEKISYIEEVGYHYRIRNNSLSTKDENALMSLKADKRFVDLVKIQYNELTDAADYFLYFSYYHVLYQNMKRGLSKIGAGQNGYGSNGGNDLLLEMKKCIPGTLRVGGLGLRDRIKIYATRCGEPWLTLFIKLSQLGK